MRVLYCLNIDSLSGPWTESNSARKRRRGLSVKMASLTTILSYITNYVKRNLVSCNKGHLTIYIFNKILV